MINDISYFLPEYPNIVNKDFYSDIYVKKEFNELKLDEFENKHIDKNGNSFYNHQKMISRFLSSNTNYNELLIFHEMGSGKSCVSVNVIEQIKTENKYKGALYLNKGTSSINNFKKEIIYKCTNGKYLEDDKKKLKEFYHFNTFEKFSKLYEKNPTYTSKKYNNFVIIIDEVHNLRIQGNIYSNISNFLHNIKGCKILLLSGTPMKDDISEISSIMNLILPKNESLSESIDFINEYFKKNDEDDDNLNIYLFKDDDKINKFKEKIKGRISYLRAMKPNNIKINYKGNHLGKLKYLNVVSDTMSDFQSKYYKEALDLDQSSGDDTMGVYINSREASLFVYPDGSYGSIGFSKYIETKTSKLKKGLKYLSLNNTLKSKLKENNTILKNIENFSIKYAKTIENILSNQKKCVFVYSSSVNGSGLILFGLLLELFGFTKCNRLKIDDETPKIPRYMLLTSDSTSDRDISNIVDTFNNPKNYEGDYIRVILGSKKISEGLSFYNIQIEEILTPWFNYSETSQAISRGIRLESHKNLLEHNKHVSVDIFQRVAVPNIEIKSIDLYMYEISETKDISIKNVERVIKESCFDCQLNIKRNKKQDMYNNTRDCEYNICEYKCDGINEEDLVKKLDYSTYQIYYSNTDDIIDKIKEIFKLKFYIHYNDLKKIIKNGNDIQDFEIISALNIAINNNIIFNKKYYLKEDKNIYFLVDNILSKNDMFITYYKKHNIPIKQKFNTILNDIYFKTTLKTIEKIFTSTDIEYLKNLLELIHPNKIIQMMIEQSLIAKIKDIQKNKTSRDLLLEYYKYYYDQYDYKGTKIYLFYYNEKMRYLNQDNFKWINCDQEIIDFYISIKTTEQQNIIDKCIRLNIGYYGIYTYIDNKFYIKDISKNLETKKSAQNRGKECISNGGWTPEILMDIIINKLEIKLDETNFYIKEKDNILNDIRKKLNFSLKINPTNYNTNDIKITKKILQEIQQKYRELKSNDISIISLKNIMINIISETTIYKKIIKNTNFNIYKNLEQLSDIMIINLLWYCSLNINDLCMYIKNKFMEMGLIFITNKR